MVYLDSRLEVYFSRKYANAVADKEKINILI
ncbi:hypothetical protein QE429_004817 [Bacillus sp. SORGH_AS 510]|nr:hypothetical protein [Bacillus sp. SORGH_AS_0510]